MGTKDEIPTEHIEQVGFVAWFQVNFPQHIIFAIPNGDKRSISVAKRLKAEGVMPGVPDLFVPSFNLWIEMKRVKGGKVSDDQKEMHEYLENIGHTVIIGYGAKDASEKVLEMFKA